MSFIQFIVKIWLFLLDPFKFIWSYFHFLEICNDWHLRKYFFNKCLQPKYELLLIRLAWHIFWYWILIFYYQFFIFFLNDVVLKMSSSSLFNLIFFQIWTKMNKPIVQWSKFCLWSLSSLHFQINSLMGFSILSGEDFLVI
jgi:hypothetical protein